jgi:hypothetical protein
LATFITLFLGDLHTPIDCFLLPYEQLQTKDTGKNEFCGIYLPDESSIYVANDYKQISPLDIFLHELGHAIVTELSSYKTEEQKCDILAIRLKNIFKQRKKIYGFFGQL